MFRFFYECFYNVNQQKLLALLSFFFRATRESFIPLFSSSPLPLSPSYQQQKSAIYNKISNDEEVANFNYRSDKSLRVCLKLLFAKKNVRYIFFLVYHTLIALFYASVLKISRLHYKMLYEPFLPSEMHIISAINTDIFLHF